MRANAVAFTAALRLPSLSWQRALELSGGPKMGSFGPDNGKALDSWGGISGFHVFVFFSLGDGWHV